MAQAVPVLNSTATGVGVSKLALGPVTENVTLAANVVTRTEDSHFHEVLKRTSSAPVLVYPPEQDRGWIIPKLPLIELTISIHIDPCGLSDAAAPANINLEHTRQMLLASLQDKTLKEILAQPGNQPMAETLAFPIRTLFQEMHAALGYTTNCCKYQQWPSVKCLYTDTVYGLEIENLALRNE